MQLITLISDWGNNDLSLGIMKGMLYSSVEDSRIVDLCHNVDLAQRDQAPFMLSHLFQRFPVGTIHILLEGVSSSMISQPLVMQMGGYYFIAYDKDAISVLSYGQEAESEIRICNTEGENALQKIADMAAACADGSWKEKSEVWEKPVKAARPLTVQVGNTRIIGDIMYVDDHNNIVTDIRTDVFMEMMEKSQSFSCTIGTTKVTEFNTRFIETFSAYFMPNDLGLIQIVMYGGKVTMLPRWALNTRVEIVFE